LLISSAEEAKDQREHDRKDKRCHDREIDANISIRALVFDITWQKRKAGRDAGPLGSRASVREPTNEGKSQHHDNEDFEKGIHHAIGERLGPTSQLQLDLGPSAAFLHHDAWNVGYRQFLPQACADVSCTYRIGGFIMTIGSFGFGIYELQRIAKAGDRISALNDKVNELPGKIGADLRDITKTLADVVIGTTKQTQQPAPTPPVQQPASTPPVQPTTSTSPVQPPEPTTPAYERWR
jgi:hypothetical protein